VVVIWRLISGILSLAFGVYILISPWALNKPAFIGVGVICLVLGIILTPSLQTALPLFLVAVYCFARGLGLFSQLLRFGISIPATIYGMWLIVTFFTSSRADELRAAPSEELTSDLE
jgi:hypothetical protein